MTKILTSTWMTALLSALIYLGATVAFWKTPKLASAEKALASAGNNMGPSWDFVNPEADQLIEELKAEKKTLQIKEQQESDLAQRLEAERAELTAVSEAVHKMQADFDQSVVRITAEETVNLKKLAKIYSNMSPESAANIFANLDDLAVVKIMVFMKEQDTAAILESLSKKGEADAKRTAALSERLRVASAQKVTPK